ncbi:hypothetical protein B0H14DRAFT_2599754 [Mycena olivaceomarginata]|nr:hypothetical protein B0H14DRAFT_2599754 [Mycena olivaceomarginata]
MVSLAVDGEARRRMESGSKLGKRFQAHRVPLPKSETRERVSTAWGGTGKQLLLDLKTRTECLALNVVLWLEQSPWAEKGQVLACRPDSSPCRRYVVVTPAGTPATWSRELRGAARLGVESLDKYIPTIPITLVLYCKIQYPSDDFWGF